MRHILALLLFIAVPALGENLFVDPNNPEGFATIAEAVKRADEGDVIFVSEGFYSEQVNIEKNISLIGEGADLVILTYAQTGHTINISAENDTTTLIEGLTITAKGGWGITIADGGSATIRNCTITRCSAGAISLSTSSSIVRLNQLTENNAGVIYLNNDQGSIISNNIIRGNISGSGDNWGRRHTFLVKSSAQNTVIANNLIKGNVGSSSILYMWGASATIKNNVIVENEGQAIWMTTSAGGGTAAPLITSNIITDNTGHGLYDWQPDANEVVTYNNIYNNAGGDYYQVIPDVGDIDDDPEFVNPSKDDYHLQEGSPCIDTGLTGAAHVDPDGSRNDMGMYGGPLAAFWVEPYNGPVVTSVEVNPASVQQGGTITIRATGTTVREE